MSNARNFEDNVVSAAGGAGARSFFYNGTEDEEEENDLDYRTYAIQNLVPQGDVAPQSPYELVPRLPDDSDSDSDSDADSVWSLDPDFDSLSMSEEELAEMDSRVCSSNAAGGGGSHSEDLFDLLDEVWVDGVRTTYDSQLHQNFLASL